MLNVSTFLFQWAVGGLLFLWVTTRRREVGLGYGWLMRGVFGLMLIGSIATATGSHVPGVQIVGSSLTLATTAFAFAISIAHRAAGVSGQTAQSYERSARVAAMTGIERNVEVPLTGREFPPITDLFPPIFGMIALFITGIVGADGGLVVALRLVVGAAFLGAITDAMLLGHWYLVQPGLSRNALNELTSWVLWLTPVEILVLLLPVGMLSAFTGTVSDQYDGVLTYFWLICAVTTIGLGLVTKAALKERQYSAVMAATGLLYLAILTAFGTDLVARAILHN